MIPASAARLIAFIDAPEGYEVVLGNGGATAFWDIATFGLIREKSQHLSFGEFSSKFAKAAKQAPFLADPTVVESPTGSRPEPRAEAGVDVYAWAHNETSTGVMAPVQRVTGYDTVVVIAPLPHSVPRSSFGPRLQAHQPGLQVRPAADRSQQALPEDAGIRLGAPAR